MAKEDRTRYSLKYPHYMPWSRRLFVLSPGQTIQNSEHTLKVRQVTRSPIQGEPPRIVLDSVESPPIMESNPTTPESNHEQLNLDYGFDF